MEFRSVRAPVIHSTDLELVTELFRVYDRITFNGFGEMVAQADIKSPIFGPLVVSLFVREAHYSVYAEKQVPDLAMYRGEILEEMPNKEVMLKVVHHLISEELKKLGI